MYTGQKIWVGRGEGDAFLLPSMANRHGLIAGASGTGKTITLKVLAEAFSDMGVPVFLSDIKGDLAGMCLPGEASDSLNKRLERFGLADFLYQSYPTCFWDVYGKKGHPVRTTVSDMGPLLLSRLMDLSDVQKGVLEVIFRIADDKGLLLLDLKDLKAMLQYVSDNRASLSKDYGNMSAQTLSALLRNVLVLEDNGGDQFFAEPALDIEDWMKTDISGRGYINILDCTELFLNPMLYATFMLWMLNELFERLPEAGDLDKPRLVFFFDEAHLLFNDMPKALLQKIEQVVKLIRSKAVGVYFISQSPSDLPDEVLAQLGNRVQHALRSYTPAEQKAVRTAAQTFRPNPAFDTAQVISELGTGEALVSFLDEEGRPGIVDRVMILPPQSHMGTIADEVRKDVMDCSEMGAKYDESIDRYSAYENLQHQQDLDEQTQLEQEEARKKAALEEETEKNLQREQIVRQRQLAKEAAAAERERQKELRAAALEQRRQQQRQQKELEQLITSAANGLSGSFGRELGKTIARGLFGSRRR